MLSTFPELLPDEHLLSSLVRAWRQTGLLSLDKFCKKAIGVSPSWQVPNAILTRVEIRLASMLSSLYGRPVWNYLENHSLVRFYFNAIPKRVQQSLVEGDATAYERGLRLSTRQSIRDLKSWRWCPLCVEEDFEKWGTPYWHVSHQIPGFEHCALHYATPLRDSCPRCGILAAFIGEFSLPPLNDQCPLCEDSLEASVTVHPGQSRLEQELREWTATPLGQYSAESLRECYFWNTRLERRLNLMAIAPVSSSARCTVNKQLDPLFMASSDKSLLETLGGTYEHGGKIVPRTYSLHQLIGSKDPVLHPTLHVLVIRYLFGNLKSLQHYREQLPAVIQQTRQTYRGHLLLQRHLIGLIDA